MSDNKHSDLQSESINSNVQPDALESLNNRFTHKSKESQMYEQNSTPRLELKFFHPRFWLLWLVIGFWYVLLLLPYPVLFRLGIGIGKVLFSLRKRIKLIDRRLTIAEKNLKLCFPDWSDTDRNTILVKNSESVGLAIIETGMAWFWPDWRIKRWCKVSYPETIKSHLDKGKGVLLIGLHFLNLELGGRILGLYTPGVGFYRPNDNPVWNWLQIKGRSRSNKFMIERKDIKQIMRVLREGEVIWYAPDHDYGAKTSVFAPFFAVEQTASTVGSYLLIKKTKPVVIPFVPKRLENGRGYEVILSSPIENFPIENEVVTATKMNQIIESQILMAPEQYMWFHRRFKTRPEGEPWLYD